MMKPSNCGRYFAMDTLKGIAATAVPIVARVTCLVMPHQHPPRIEKPAVNCSPLLGLVALNADAINQESCRDETDTGDGGLIPECIQPAVKAA